MSESGDATPAYRGYRLQALYALFRILSQKSDKDLTFQPEKEEDLSIQDEKGNLLEVIQVKSSDLKISIFKESFFQRIYSLTKRRNSPQIVIASFGKVGREFQRAVEQDGPERERVSKKITKICKDKGFVLSVEEAKTILDKLKLEDLNELELKEKVHSLLKEIVTGLDPYNAFDNLNYWIYDCSEKKSAITKNDLIDRLQNIGRFVSERADYHKEWFLSINPIDDQNINPNESKLHEEFYQGVSAKYEHILANADVFRPNKIREIEAKFKECSIVIIHGASGQGKSTLAYRYLHEYFPNMWRFKIELIQDRKHALSIARAIIGQANAIDFPVVVYIDVSAKDNDWPDLVKQLSIHQKIKILVTIREEDYKRSSIQGFEVEFKELDLSFDKSEACEIYHLLEKGKTPPHFLCFEDAWEKFKGDGPLMEFIYLVTQGEALQKRLKEQVTRLYDEARNGKINTCEIKLLTLVSVASAFDAHLKVKLLIDNLKLVAPQRTFDLFEKEYLLRLNEDGSLVKGVHPIRSEILANLLTDPVMSPWSQHASDCLPLMHEPDIEIFLLYAFLRQRRYTKSLQTALDSWHPVRWVAVRGVIRALIWVGIQEYVEKNQKLIQEAFEDSGMGLTFLLDTDVSDAIPGITTSFLDIFGNSNQIDGYRLKVMSYRDRQTDKSQIFVRAKTWLSNMKVFPVTPQCNEDWLGIAEVSFWLRRFGITWSFSKRVPYLELEQAVEHLPLETVADLMLGLYEGYGEDFIAWREAIDTKLLSRFRNETLTVNLQDNENKINAHFVIAFKMLNDSESDNGTVKETGNYLHNEAMRRIKLLRGILPDREAYACQGYGHNVWNEELPFDITQKEISITQLPPKWLVSINSTFRGLAELPHRPETWDDYSKSIFKLRKQILGMMKCLENGLEAYFQKPKPDKLFGKIISEKEWNGYKQILSKPLLTPSCALDEWGFIDEFRDLPIEEHSIIRGFALQKHKQFLTSFNNYRGFIKHFFDQASDAMIISQIRGKSIMDRQRKNKHEQKVIEQGFRPDFIRLSRINLSECIKKLPSFQKEFRQTFGHFLKASDLDELENQETTIFHNLWCMWYFFCTKPNLTYRNPGEEFVKKINTVTGDIKKAIEERLSNISSENFNVSIASYDHLWEDQQAIWISIDGNNGVDVYKSIEETYREVFRSVRDHRNKDTAKIVFETNWPLIIILPKIQGKCLTENAFRVSSLTLLSSMDGKLNWFNFIAQSTIPKDVLIKLSIDAWDILELEVANRFAQNALNLSLQLAHLKDLGGLFELDDQGLSQIKVYVESLTTDINTSIQIISDSKEKMENIFSELSPSDYDNHLNMLYSIQNLEKACEYIKPPFISQEETVSEIEDLIFKWADRLKEGRDFVMGAYLFWVSDTINNREIKHANII